VKADLRKALAGEFTPKFLATLDASGRPNCVPIISITPYDDEHVVFGEFMMNKTRRNLLGCGQVAITVITDALDTWSLQGTFLGFETAGERVDLINRSALFRYNAYTQIRSAGLIRVEEVSPKARLGRGRLLRDFLRARALAPCLAHRGAARGPMPLPVVEKFRRLSAVRAVGFRADDGRPRAFSVLACVPAGPGRLLLADPLFNAHADAIPVGAELAVSVITMDPVAYQVKGAYAGRRLGVGVVDVQECYSASPPLLGERLDTPQRPHRAAQSR